jgi:membrane-associated phospholipid phosphatase
MSFALCGVLVTPTRLRPLVVAVGAAFAVAIFCSFLTLEWHYPSDVIAGFLVASIWTLLGAAAVLRRPGRDELLPRP